MAGSLTLLPEAFLVALIKSDRAEATSFTALIKRTCFVFTVEVMDIGGRVNANGKISHKGGEEGRDGGRWIKMRYVHVT